MWKDLFFFSKREKQGIIVWVVLIFIVICINVFLRYTRNNEGVENDYEAFEREYAPFVASLKVIEEEQEAESFSPIEHDKDFALFTFDPNVADSLTFRRLGLSPLVTKNILKYREKGGEFKKPQDFRKIYHLPEKQYLTLLPYIHIENKTIDREPEELPASAIPPDSFRVIKYAKGTILDLNSADTTGLKKIPGIGSRIAGRIVNYRRQLGGFCRIEQLAEIDLNVDTFAGWFRVDTTKITPIDLNKASVDRLRKHPYFNFYQAKAIVEHRKKNGPLRSLKQLSLYEEFTEEDFKRMEQYSCF